MLPTIEASLAILFAFLVLIITALTTEVYATDGPRKFHESKDWAQDSDARFTACCRTKNVPGKFLPYCNYTTNIDVARLQFRELGESLTAMLTGKEVNSSLTDADREKLRALPEKPKGDDRQKLMICLYPEEAVSGMEKCCSEAGNYTCTACERDYFLSDINGPEEMKAMDEMCGEKAGVDVIVFLKCLKETTGLVTNLNLIR